MVSGEVEKCLDHQLHHIKIAPFNICRNHIFFWPEAYRGED